ncbi:hypothetical protein [Janibacter terrae]|uniref:hypothetical protein n=1 Tax=Janibacter terrae TaxID=103817 RepID=UPI001469E81C|nr:hypothetical protein [Janibacter terrae]
MECAGCGATSEGTFCSRCGARMPAAGEDGADRFWAEDEPTRAQLPAVPGPSWAQETPQSSWEDWLVQQPTTLPPAAPPAGRTSMAPPGGGRPGGPAWGLIAAACLAAVVLLGAGAGALWFVASQDDDTTTAGSATTAPTTATSTPPTTTVTSTPPPTTTVTTTASPPPTTTVTTTAAPLSAADQLNDLREESLGRLVTDGDWGVSLSAKQDGTRDDRQLTSSGSHVFRLPDILELHQAVVSTYPLDEVYLLKAEDLGSTVGADDDKIWMTIVDPGWLTSRDDAEMWCEAQFSWLSGVELDNACYPRRLSTP